MTHKTQHTPGPWKVDSSIDPEAHYQITLSDGQELPDTKANARLIESAPNLLAALTEIVAANDEYDESQAADARCARAIQQARAALSSARGSNT